MIKKFITTLQVLVIVIVSSNVYADVNKPAMIIRFKNENIQYQRSLQMLIEKAKIKKPQINFKILSILPDKSESEKQKALLRLANIKNDMMVNGISPQNIIITIEINNQVKLNEVHIYVE
jgi:hypothetical protein